RELNGCAELLQQKSQPAPDGGWTADELSRRDLAAARLAVVSQMIDLESLLNANPAVRDAVLIKLQSNYPGILAAAHVDLLQVSQNVSEQDVRTALEKGMWDSYFEPITVTDQDVLRVSLVFRDKHLNRWAARNAF